LAQTLLSQEIYSKNKHPIRFLNPIGCFVVAQLQIMEKLDPTAVSRKSDHIELAFNSQVQAQALDHRFYYEPMLAGHPERGTLPQHPMGDKVLRAPIWVSSMTGGTALASVINHNLARACAEFGMGMGLGSCRQLLYSHDHLDDFDVRAEIGPDLPLFANLGVAQIEQLLETGEMERIEKLVQVLRADGLIVHVNPLQEAMQPEGDFFKRSPLEIVQEVLHRFDFPIIVKEVGQGFGPESLKALLQLPLYAIEFAAAGGTNFAKLELLRSDSVKQEIFGKIAHVGHTAEEMVHWCNAIVDEYGAPDIKVKHLIISGGVGHFLDGYYLTQKSKIPAVYGQASALLRHARGEYEVLQQYLQSQIEGLGLAFAFLRVR
jgi:isopentenyl-diphosphate Delta-isomerase